MLAVVLAALAVALVLGWIGYTQWTARRPSLLREHLRERYAVTTKTQETFVGLLMAVDAEVVVLRNAVTVKPSGERVPVDGELLLPRDSVAYLQRPSVA